MTCFKCRAELPEGALYCPACGKKQVAEKRKGRARSNGTGTAYKRGRTWTGQAPGYTTVEQTPDGGLRTVRHRPTKGGFATKTEALAWAAAQRGDIEPVPPTLLELWEGWSANDMERLSRDKITAYRKARERLEPIIARRIDTLTLDDLQRTVNASTSTYYTARDVKSLLSHLYKRAMASGGGSGKITVNIARYIVLPVLDEQEPEPFDEQEVAAIWTAWDGGDVMAGYLLLMIYTSMMPGELLACRADMIDYGRHEIYGCGRKTKKRRDVPIVFPAFLSPVLERLAELASPNTGRLWARNKDRLYHEYHQFTARIGVRDLPPYACRHTTATAAVKKGVELPVVQQIMRHAKLSSTERYIHVSTEAAHAGINKLDKGAGGGGKQ